MPVMLIQNNHRGPLVFTDEGPPKVQIEWQGQGDADGRDLQEAPDHLVESITFRRLLNRGVITVVEANAAVEAKLAAQGQTWAQHQTDRDAAVEAAMDRQEQNDIVVEACLGPGPNGACGAAVMVRESERYDHPPLCPHHGHLSHQFTPTETGEHTRQGKPMVTWLKVTAGSSNVVPN